MLDGIIVIFSNGNLAIPLEGLCMDRHPLLCYPQGNRRMFSEV